MTASCYISEDLHLEGNIECGVNCVEGIHGSQVSCCQHDSIFKVLWCEHITDILLFLLLFAHASGVRGKSVYFNLLGSCEWNYIITLSGYSNYQMEPIENKYSW